MKLCFAGGCGEHGRNCFLLEGEKYNIMVDCGIMAGDSSPMPRLTPEQIRRTRYVLITHSHKDHTGAAPWLMENGFEGVFVMTAETARQLPFSLPFAKLLPAPEEKDSFHLEDVKVDYGMSGHCAGSVWYRIHWEKQRIFFSGDYNFYSDVYEHAFLQNKKAEIAVMDSCYPEGKWSQHDFMLALTRCISGGKDVLLPVPKYGRGLDILLLLIRNFPDIRVKLDSHLQSEVLHLRAIKKWLRRDAYDELRRWRPGSRQGAQSVFLLSDPQLASKAGRDLADLYAKNEAPVLFSGNVDDGSYAEKLLKSGCAELSVLPVHNSDKEYEMMKRANNFGKTVAVHTPRLACPGDILLQSETQNEIT